MSVHCVTVITTNAWIYAMQYATAMAETCGWQATSCEQAAKIIMASAARRQYRGDFDPPHVALKGAARSFIVEGDFIAQSS